MVGNVLGPHVSMQNEESIRRTDEFHELQNLETDSHCFDGVRFTASTARRTGLCNLDHGIDGTITHRCTVALESLTDDDKEPRRIEEIMLKFLVDELRVEHRSEVRSLRGVSLDLCLKCGGISVCV